MPQQRRYVSRSRIFFHVLPGLITLALCAPLIARGQDAPARFLIAIGQTRSAITAACGKPFGPWRENASDFNASSIGMPSGMWSVYHLSPSESRTYVTIAHFDPDDKVDALMLEPTGNWTVAQILKDHSSLATICAASCDLIQVSEKQGNTSLLLKPKSTASSTRVIYFIGDTGSRFRSVTATDSIVSWAYVLQLTDFEKHHAGAATKTTGTWSP